jgi:hypothetical protein
MWPNHPEVKPGTYPPLPLIEGDRIIDGEVTADDQCRRQHLRGDKNWVAGVEPAAAGEPPARQPPTLGLALKDEDFGQGAPCAGTPAYMSPEQARHEGHRVDGRSDIFSLGVVFYQLLIRRRPFRAHNVQDLLDQVATVDPRPPRQIDDTIPRELERICLKALAKRATERYNTARDMADDLHYFLHGDARPVLSSPDLQPQGAAPQPVLPAAPAVTPAVSFDSEPAVQVVPKGLRAFDERDADFFLELVPGPRNRDGLPESIRFWKDRIEEVDPDRTFAVGVIYGPSGCGKSSLVRAGLLPRLRKHVLRAYIEAGPGETEPRLLRGLSEICSDLAGDLDLTSSLEALRTRPILPTGQKVLIVLDQFEQWLRTEGRGEGQTDLVRALRQCDGQHVQAIVLVRDEFWMAATRFMGALEFRLQEGENSAAVDLFDQDHARKVLAAFGRAYNRLPERLDEQTREQEAFLEQAIDGLAQDGKIIPVRLALFAQMVKGKPWTPASLRQVGGIAGVGVTFLEETFSSSSAPPPHRLHQKAAQLVLKALLPETGTDIKGRMRSRDELLAISDYAERPRDFPELIGILDLDLRLITPTEAEAEASDQSDRSDRSDHAVGRGSPDPAPTPDRRSPGSAPPTEAGRPSVPPVARPGDPATTEALTRPAHSPLSTHHSPTRYYQLTHDYLVPALREWLTRKQRETRRGRAEIRLAERAALWNAKPQNRLLPSLLEWANIRLLTKKHDWTEPQRKMMRQAARTHGWRSALTLAGLIALAAAGVVVSNQVAAQREATRIEGLVRGLVSAEPSRVPDIVKQLDAKPAVATPLLARLISGPAETPDEKRAQLHARLAVVSRDASQVEPLLEELLTGKVTNVLPIRHLLRPYAAGLTERLRSLLRNEKADPERRFRAALALADDIPASEAASWTEADLKFVAGRLVSSNAEFQPLLRAALRPIHSRLLDDLEHLFADSQATDAQRQGAANALADYAEKDVARLTRLLAVATPEQFAVLYPIVAASRPPATIEELGKIAATPPPEKLGSVERVPYGQRRAGAAVTLLRLGERDKVLPVFEVTDDPEALTQFIFRCRARGVEVVALLDCLRLVSDGPANRYPREARYALLLALGEFTLADVSASRRDALIKQLAGWYRHDPSSGVHGAAGWLLRRWGQADLVHQVDETATPYSPEREWFTLRITVKPAPPPERHERGSREDASAKSAAAKGDASAKSKAGATARSAASGTAANPKPAPPPKTFHYTFIVFPANEFTIGSNDEPGRFKNEVRHRVRLTRPFAILA